MRTEKIFVLVFIPIHRCTNIAFISSPVNDMPELEEKNEQLEKQVKVLKEEKSQWQKAVVIKKESNDHDLSVKSTKKPNDHDVAAKSKNDGNVAILLDLLSEIKMKVEYFPRSR